MTAIREGGFLSCTGERLAVERLRDLPSDLVAWRDDLLSESRQGGPGRASIRAGRCLLLDEAHAAFEFAAHDPLIRMWSDGTYSDRYLDHLLGDHVVPRRLSLRGERVLHATAVEFDSVAVAFIGVSTAGKSTLAAASVNAGGRLLADDTLLLVLSEDAVAVVPTATHCRLRADVASMLPVPSETAPNNGDRPVPLSLVCIVDRGADQLQLTECGPAAGVVALARSAFTPEASEVDPAAVLDHFVPVFERTRVATLRYPNGLHVLADVVDLLRRSLDSGRPDSAQSPTIRT